ncbi:MAG: phage tail protein [Rheinheimera sp.]|nr:phage tail protein [Rheinheimera sp.]|tara:strand:+ start:3153 stop:3404 length:252 start_codon:yes stop_codon:yes gene_type:complete
MAKVTELKKPIKRGEKEITSINFQEPNSGSLRGLELMAIMRMDVTQVRKLVPRISDITEAEFDTLCPADLASVCADVVGFFME